jgi:hypothetical protein
MKAEVKDNKVVIELDRHEAETLVRWTEIVEKVSAYGFWDYWDAGAYAGQSDAMEPGWFQHEVHIATQKLWTAQQRAEYEASKGPQP